MDIWVVSAQEGLYRLKKAAKDRLGIGPGLQVIGWASESGSMPITWSTSEAGLHLKCPSCGKSLALHAALVSEPRPVLNSRSSQTTGCGSWFANWWERRVAAPQARRAPLISYGSRYPSGSHRYAHGTDTLFGRAWDGGASASGFAAVSGSQEATGVRIWAGASASGSAASTGSYASASLLSIREEPEAQRDDC